jgi:hypothetical protein|tara:strand:- start:627 stop:1010 length:384 start_codon:yes stop_codon:yes gene_type:complete
MIQILAPLANTLIKRLFPDKEKQQEAQLEFQGMLADGSFKEFEKQADIIIQEAQSQHFLTSNWRPITMLLFAAIIGNNYIIYPYLSLFWMDAPMLEIPPDMWDLLKIGLGGYVVGRSGEKMVNTWKK